MSQPWLSVIMPTYNGAQFLPAALWSVVAQPCMDFEVIAVDDGSTDETPAILRSFAKRIPMTIIEVPHRGSWAANTNLGMEAAKGRYLCWLHQDDCWCPERLTALRIVTDLHPETALVLHPCWYANGEGRRIGYWRCPLPARGRPLEPEEVLKRLIVQCFVATCGAMFSARAARQAGPLDERLWYSADWEFWLRLARQGTTVYHPRPLAMFRLHSGAQTLGCARRASELRWQQQAVLERHLSRAAVNRSGAMVASFSADVNVALAMLAGGKGREVNWRELARRYFWLGPAGWYGYLRDSRVLERCVSRVQAGAIQWARPSGVAAAPPPRRAPVALPQRAK